MLSGACNSGPTSNSAVDQYTVKGQSPICTRAFLQLFVQHIAVREDKPMAMLFVLSILCCCSQPLAMPLSTAAPIHRMQPAHCNHKTTTAHCGKHIFAPNRRPSEQKHSELHSKAAMLVAATSNSVHAPSLWVLPLTSTLHSQKLRSLTSELP